MNYWYESLAHIEKIQQENQHTLSVDQQIEIAKIKAILAVGQDLNALRLGDHEPFN